MAYKNELKRLEEENKALSRIIEELEAELEEPDETELIEQEQYYELNNKE